MGKKDTRTSKLPKRAFTEPSVAAVVIFIIILLVLVPNTAALHTNRASVQILILIFLSPLALPGFFCAYHTGLAIGKVIYKKWHKGLSASFLATIIMQLACIALCFGIETAFAGYPIQVCFDSCHKIATGDVIISYLIFSTILFLPAYYALFRYNSWSHKFSHK